MWSTNKQRFLLWIEGDYLNNKKEGTGIFWWTTGSHAGDRYEGQFEDDKRLKHYFIELFHNLKLILPLNSILFLIKIIISGTGMECIAILMVTSTMDPGQMEIKTVKDYFCMPVETD